MGHEPRTGEKRAGEGSGAKKSESLHGWHCFANTARLSSNAAFWLVKNDRSCHYDTNQRRWWSNTSMGPGSQMRCEICFWNFSKTFGRSIWKRESQRRTRKGSELSFRRKDVFAVMLTGSGKSSTACMCSGDQGSSRRATFQYCCFPSRLDPLNRYVLRWHTARSSISIFNCERTLSAGRWPRWLRISELC